MEADPAVGVGGVSDDFEDALLGGALDRGVDGGGDHAGHEGWKHSRGLGPGNENLRRATLADGTTLLVVVHDLDDGGADELAGAVEVSLRLEVFEIRGQLSI